MNSQKRKGDRAEMEVQGILRDLTGYPARRALGAGRQDDIGDITGMPNLCVSVVNYRDVTRGIRDKLATLEQQMGNAGCDFGCVFARLPGGRYVVAMTPELFATLYREATA